LGFGGALLGGVVAEGAVAVGGQKAGEQRRDDWPTSNSAPTRLNHEATRIRAT